MDLIIINGYTPPSPTKFEVEFKSKNSTRVELENGYDTTERIRVQIPTISVAWVNVTEAEAIAITNAVTPAKFNCQYFFGTMKEARVKCETPKLALKLVNGDERYYDLSLTLEG